MAIATLFWSTLAVALDPQPPVLVSLRWGTSEPTGGLCAAPMYFGANSRYLSFDCLGDDLAPGDSNGRRDNVLLDRTANATELISISTTGQQTFHDSFAGYPASNGQQVVFASMGPLHPDYWPPTGPSWPIGRLAVYLRDRVSGETQLIGRDAFGQALTGNPNLHGADFASNEVLFAYDGDIRIGPAPIPGFGTQLWIRNWVTGDIQLISSTLAGAPAGGVLGSFSATGRYVAFVSGADALGPPARLGDANIYVRDRTTGSTERLTWPRVGGEFQGPQLIVARPRISANGRYVVFSSPNTELHPDTATAGGTHVYLVDSQTGQLEHLSPTPGYPSYNFNPDISDDGRYVAWSTRNFSPDGPVNPPADMRAIWVLDRDTGQRANITVPLGPLYQDNAVYLDLAPDGSAVAFTWRVADPSSPFFGRNLLYTVQLHGSRLAGPPVPVTHSSPWVWALLASMLLLIGSRNQRSDARADKRVGSPYLPGNA